MNELSFDQLLGTKTILESYSNNVNGISPSQVRERANLVVQEYRSYKSPQDQNTYLEIHNHQLQRYIYEYYGIEVNVSLIDSEVIFWNAASPAKAMPDIKQLLEYLVKKDIRIGVVSNIGFSSEALRQRLKKYLPSIEFDIIISSADYIFRKPSSKIFDIAYQKLNQVTKSVILPQDIWFCGDDFECDVMGSMAYGFQPIWYCLKDVEDIMDDRIVKVSHWRSVLTTLKELENYS